MTEEEKRRYRPGGKVATSQIHIRITEDERRRWEAAAKRAGQSISEWLRAAAERATRR